MSTSTIKAAEIPLQILKALRGHSLSGVTNQELAQQIDTSPATITRSLKTLEKHGFVQKLDDGSYALGNILVVISHCHAQEIDRAQSRVSEHIQRVFAGVKQIKEA